MPNLKDREQKTTDHKSGSKQNTSNRGFASMDEAKQREIATKGGKASHGGGRKPKSNGNSERS
jgi:general stress protein YciG